MNQGYLVVAVFADSIAQPIMGAKVKISNINTIFETNIDGKLEPITLNAPSVLNSTIPNQEDPYFTYDIEVEKDGMVKKIVKGVQIYPNITSTQNVILHSSDNNNMNEEILIMEPPVLNGNYAPKYVENEDVAAPIVLSDVVIPEYVIVHDGIPTDTRAKEYYVPFADYIKNVACSEIYSSWEKEALKANVLAILSFTLNRVYTEWYQSKGYQFTITSVTAYDQKYTHERTLFDSITETVDEMLGKYIKRTDKDEPMFAQYCDGTTLQNMGWLWQWGSQELAIEGFQYLDILKYYYGNTIEEKETTTVEGLPTSFPGTVLKLGSCGEDVMKIQNQLNVIRGNYPGLTQIINPNGEFDQNTKDAVLRFQEVFDIYETGVVDYSTWYAISYLYLAVKRMIFGVYDR